MSSKCNGFFDVIFKRTGVKQVGDREYGYLRCKPASAFVVHVRRKDVTISFGTDGKESHLSSDALMEWANRSGILREEMVDGQYFEMKRGAKNKNKAAVSVRIPYADEEELNSDALIGQVVALVELLREKTTGLVEARPSKNKPTAVTPEKETEILSAEDAASLVKKTLAEIIRQNAAEFKESESFKVRPGYGYDKFYLDRVDGAYDMSLQGLIHYILFEKGIYKKVLSPAQYEDMERVVKEDPESIYSPDWDDDDCEETQEMLDEIYATCIRFVATTLLDLGFDVKEQFCDYLDDDEALDKEEEEYTYMLGISLEDGCELECDELLDACAQATVKYGNELKEIPQNIECFFLLAKVGDKRLALKVRMYSELYSGMEQSEQAEALVKYMKGGALGEIPEVFSEGTEEIKLLFTIKDPSDKFSLWEDDFNQYAEAVGGAIKVIGMEFEFGDYAIQQWDDGGYDEGVLCEPDTAEEYYVGLESGKSLKFEGLKESDFDLSNYAILNVFPESD